MNILIVDDDFITLTKLLTNLSGYAKCLPATHAHQAIETFTDYTKKGDLFSLVLIDINLPDDSGFDLINQIKQVEDKLKVAPAKKVIMTAQSNAENVKKAVALHLDGLLAKPIRSKTLIAKLTSLGLIKSWQTKDGSSSSSENQTKKPENKPKKPDEPEKESYSSVAELKLHIRDRKKEIFKFSLDDPVMKQLLDSLAEVDAERKFHGK